MKLKQSVNPYEIEVSARGSYYHVVFGKHAYGNFLCIPNWDVGCELADFSDIFWNTERLCKHLNKTDALSVAKALSIIKEHLG
jgi:hypothetical protein